MVRFHTTKSSNFLMIMMLISFICSSNTIKDYKFNNHPSSSNIKQVESYCLVFPSFLSGSNGGVAGDLEILIDFASIIGKIELINFPLRSGSNFAPEGKDVYYFVFYILYEFYSDYFDGMLNIIIGLNYEVGECMIIKNGEKNGLCIR